jgi:hypothetical protein
MCAHVYGVLGLSDDETKWNERPLPVSVAGAICSHYGGGDGLLKRE